MTDKTPRQLAQERIELSYEYSEKGKRFTELKKLKAVWWKSCREDYKSDASAERAWDLTEEGQEFEELRMEMKTIEMQMSSIKTMIQVLDSESRNFY